MNNVCEFCGASFTAIRNLITHKRTAKYCLELRDEETLPYSCQDCGKTFTNDIRLKRHIKQCEYYISEYVQRLLDQKDAEIQELKEDKQELEENIISLETELEHHKLEDARLKVYEKEYYAVRDRPTNTTNTNNNINTTNNKLKLVNTSTIDPFTIDLVQKRLQNGYTYDMFMLGSMGVKRFITAMIMKDDEKNYVTTDVSRPNFHRFKETRKWSLDAGAKFLTDVFNEMKPTISAYWDKFNGEADTAKSVEEHESFDIIRDRVKPIVLAIEGSPESKHRSELLGDVIKHIKPYVAV